MKRLAKIAFLSLTGLGLLGLYTSQAGAAQEHERAGGAHMERAPGHVDGRGQVLDSRYNHGRYYPSFGTRVGVLPGGYRPFFFHGSPFYFWGGIWYAPGPGGFVVVGPPFGVVLSILPPYYSTVWIGGLPYYYANNVYYSWDPAQNGYVVVAPPAGADQPADAPPPAAAQGDLIIYPKNGQTTDQQAADRYECHTWAKGQTGFDPTQPGGGPGGDQNRSNYNRAMSACLQARGYQVN